MQDSLILERNDIGGNWSENSLSVVVDCITHRPQAKPFCSTSVLKQSFDEVTFDQAQDVIVVNGHRTDRNRSNHLKTALEKEALQPATRSNHPNRQFSFQKPRYLQDERLPNLQSQMQVHSPREVDDLKRVLHQRKQKTELPTRVQSPQHPATSATASSKQNQQLELIKSHIVKPKRRGRNMLNTGGLYDVQTMSTGGQSMTAFTKTEQQHQHRFSSGVLSGTESERPGILKRPQSSAIRQSSLSQKRSHGSLTRQPSKQKAGYLNIDDQGAVPTKFPQEKTIIPFKNVKITPELASAVVKDYLLPMFESDGKKILKRKGTNQKQETQVNLSANVVPTTVFQELKLSQVLGEQVASMRDQILLKTEEIESLQSVIKSKDSQITQLRTQLAESKLKFKRADVLASVGALKTKALNVQMQTQSLSAESLQTLLECTEEHLKRVVRELATTKVKEEKSLNIAISNRQIAELLKIENQIIREQLGMLFSSMKSLGDVKQMQDNYDLQIQLIKQKEQEMVAVFNENETEKLQNLNKIDEQAQIIHDIWTTKQKLLESKQRKEKQMKARIEALEAETEKNKELKKDTLENLLKAQKTINMLQYEIQRCNMKITKLRKRRNVDMSKKVCINCQKEYNHNENYNWSCCTHRSEWGGTMWWCCGKTKITAAGCKFQKHISKEAGDEEDENAAVITAKVQCAVCKQHGHRANECDKDPNMRTSHDVESEAKRVGKILTAHKQYTDFFVTQKLLERAILVSNDRTVAQLLSQDDFNYSKYNDAVFDINIPMDIEGISDGSDDLLQEESHSDREGECLTEAKEDKPKEKSGQVKGKKTTIKLFSREQRSNLRMQQEQDPFSLLTMELSENRLQPHSNLLYVQDTVKQLVDMRSSKNKNPAKKKHRRRRVNHNNSQDKWDSQSGGSFYSRQTFNSAFRRSGETSGFARRQQSQRQLKALRPHHGGEGTTKEDILELQKELNLDFDHSLDSHSPDHLGRLVLPTQTKHSHEQEAPPHTSEPQVISDQQAGEKPAQKRQKSLADLITGAGSDNNETSTMLQKAAPGEKETSDLTMLPRQNSSPQVLHKNPGDSTKPSLHKKLSNETLKVKRRTSSNKSQDSVSEPDPAKPSADATSKQ